MGKPRSRSTISKKTRPLKGGGAGRRKKKGGKTMSVAWDFDYVDGKGFTYREQIKRGESAKRTGGPLHLRE